MTGCYGVSMVVREIQVILVEDLMTEAMGLIVRQSMSCTIAAWPGHYIGVDIAPGNHPCDHGLMA